MNYFARYRLIESIFCLKDLKFKQIGMKYDICQCYIKCHRKLIEHLRDPIVNEQDNILIDIVEQFENLVRDCASELQKLNENPEVIDAVKSKVFAFSLLHYLKKSTERKFNEGDFIESEVHLMHRAIHSRYRAAESLRFANLPRISDILYNVLSIPKSLARHVTIPGVIYYNPGDLIMGDISTVIIICGTVTEIYIDDSENDIEREVTTGGIAGLMNLLIDACRTSCIIKAKGEVRLVKLYRDHIIQNNCYLETALKIIAVNCILQRKQQLKLYRKSDNVIREKLRCARVVYVYHDNQYYDQDRIIIMSQSRRYPICIFIGKNRPNPSEFPKLCVILPSDFRLLFELESTELNLDGMRNPLIMGMRSTIP